MSMKKELRNKRNLTQYSLIKLTNSAIKWTWDHDLVTSRISLLERKLWIGLSVLGVVVAISNPQSIKLLKPLLSSAESVIMQPAYAFVNGSY